MDVRIYSSPLILAIGRLLIANVIATIRDSIVVFYPMYTEIFSKLYEHNIILYHTILYSVVYYTIL